MQIAYCDACDFLAAFRIKPPPQRGGSGHSGGSVGSINNLALELPAKISPRCECSVVPVVRPTRESLLKTGLVIGGTLIDQLKLAERAHLGRSCLTDTVGGSGSPDLHI